MRWAAIVVAVAGCYRSHFDPCQIACGANDVCPASSQCFGGTCRPMNGTCGTPEIGDASVGFPDEHFIPPGCFEGVFLPGVVCPLITDVPLSGTVDTTTCPGTAIVDTSDRELCILAYDQLDISTAVRFTGPDPVVLMADTIIVHAPIDLSSGGAGALASCDVVENAVEISSGGAGGSLAFSGGKGGAGGGGGMGGKPNAAMAPTSLHGGCSGGGNTQSAVTGGLGGGAIYLRAHTLALVPGATITVAGGGGDGGPSGAYGAGGGGAGGMIVVNTEDLAQDLGSFAINGGGGGGGGGDLGAGSSGLSDGTGGPGGVVSNNMPSGGGAGSSTTGGAGASSAMFGAGGGGGGGGIVMSFRGNGPAPLPRR